MDRPEFHRLADRELNEAAQYYDLEDPGLGSFFLEELDRCLQSIEDHPEAGMILRGSVRRRLLHRFSYAILYKIKPSGIRILAVMNLKRRPTYWVGASNAAAAAQLLLSADRLRRQLKHALICGLENEVVVMSVEPIPPEALRSVPGLDTPQRFYQVLRAPGPLAGMSFPNGPPWKSIASAGFESIVCLTDNTPPYDPSPLRVLRALKFKDLVRGAHPDNPQCEAAMLRDVVQAVVDELRSGRGVVVHCAGGTGRTGTVIACTLAALGMPQDEVFKYMALLLVGALGSSRGRATRRAPVGRRLT